MQAENCFGNSYNLADKHPELTYVEGYTLHEATDFPVFHAWVVDKEGNVIDATWPTPGIEYFGVPFTLDDVLIGMAKRSRHGLIDHWECGWPLLKNGYKPARKKAKSFSAVEKKSPRKK
jgi:hypothetical protein